MKNQELNPVLGDLPGASETTPEGTKKCPRCKAEVDSASLINKRGKPTWCPACRKGYSDKLVSLGPGTAKPIPKDLEELVDLLIKAAHEEGAWRRLAVNAVGARRKQCWSAAFRSGRRTKLLREQVLKQASSTAK